MKLTCDLCGSELQMNADSQGATCTGCGMNYALDTLRQKLNAQPQPPTPSNSVFSPCAPEQPVSQQPATRELILNRKFDLQAMLFAVTVVLDGEEVAFEAQKLLALSLEGSVG